jgi:hypothetical protein
MVSKLVGGLLWKTAKIRQDGLGEILGRVGVGLPSRAQLLPESGETVVGCFLETPKDVVALGILGGRNFACLLKGKARHEDMEFDGVGVVGDREVERAGDAAAAQEACNVESPHVTERLCHATRGGVSTEVLISQEFSGRDPFSDGVTRSFQRCRGHEKEALVEGQGW